MILCSNKPCQELQSNPLNFMQKHLVLKQWCARISKSNWHFKFWSSKALVRCCMCVSEHWLNIYDISNIVIPGFTSTTASLWSKDSCSVLLQLTQTLSINVMTLFKLVWREIRCFGGQWFYIGFLSTADDYL